jgi:hypothetical protein
LIFFFFFDTFFYYSNFFFHSAGVTDLLTLSAHALFRTPTRFAVLFPPSLAPISAAGPLPTKVDQSAIVAAWAMRIVE